MGDAVKAVWQPIESIFNPGAATRKQEKLLSKQEDLLNQRAEAEDKKRATRERILLARSGRGYGGLTLGGSPNGVQDTLG